MTVEKDYNDKIEQLNKKLEQDSNNEELLFELGKLYFITQNYDRSKEIFDKLKINTKNAEVFNYLGLIDLEKTELIEAIKNFSTASNLDRNNPKYFYNLANAYFYNGWIKEAQTSYSNALYLSPDNQDYRYSLAYMYYDTKDFARAQKEVDAVLYVNPNHNYARVLNALLKAENKDFLGAKKILEDNIIQGFDDEFTKVSLSKICYELGIFDRAEKLLLEVIEKNPNNLDYMCELSKIYTKQKNYDKALFIADKMINKNANYINAYITGANAAYLKGEWELVKNYAQEIISLDINCAKGYYYLGLSREKTGDIDEAVECIKRAILYDLNNPLYYAKMSDLYCAKGDYKSGFDYISEAASLDDTNEYKFKYSQLLKLSRKN